MIVQLLAQSADPISHSYFGSWMIAGGMALTLLLNALALLNRNKVQQRQIVDQPLKVEGTPKYAHQAELEAFKSSVNSRLERLEVKMESDYRHMMSAGEQRSQKITEAIAESGRHAEARMNDLKDILTEKLDQCLKEAYHRINEHGEAIASLNTALKIKH
jgi:DNA anti-recombination protein RmuC